MDENSRGEQVSTFQGYKRVSKFQGYKVSKLKPTTPHTFDLAVASNLETLPWKP
jgi:hypothetical protein